MTGRDGVGTVARSMKAESFFVQMVNSDCGADLSLVQFEITTICHDGRVYSSIRRPLEGRIEEWQWVWYQGKH